MKTALSEVNITIISVIAIGLVAAVAIPMITSTLGNVNKESNCTACGGAWDGASCQPQGSIDSAQLNSCISSLESQQ